MPKKYNIEVAPAPSRFPTIGKFAIERSEECINCGRCALACVYEVHSRQENDPRCMAEPIDYRCKGCFRCVQECPKEALKVRNRKDYRCLGDLYWTPEIISKTWVQAETGKVPVSGAGYSGPFSGDGFDSMWTDMSEIVRPTRDGIHGREYISTSVDIGRKAPAIKFDAYGKIALPLPPTVTIPLPIIFDTLPFGRHNNVYEAMARATSVLDTIMLVNPDDWFNPGYRRTLVPVFTQFSQRFNASERNCVDLIQNSRMAEVEYNEAVVKGIKAVKRINSEIIISVRVPCDTSVEEIVGELAFAGVEVVHLYANSNGRAIESSAEPRFITDTIRRVHRHLVDLKLRDEVTLIVSGGIATPEHVAKALICGADVTAIDLPLLIAFECRYCKRCLEGLPCPVALKDIDPHYGAQRIINLMGAWRNQLLEVLGAMGLREVRRLRGEVGRAIVQEDIQKETFDNVFAKEMLYDVKAKN